jgi:Domain of unknown function (DUF4407)
MERSKYFWVWTAVFFTGIFAGLSAWFAFTFVLKTGDAPLTSEQILTCIGIGIFWWLLIFSLDRFIVSSIKKSSSFFLQFLQALPRMILAVVIWLVIAMPLELKIFEKEINLSLVKMQTEELITNKKIQEESYQTEFDRSDKKFDELKQSITIRNIEKTEIESAIAKLPYKSCTGKNNDGTSYKYTCRPGITALKDKLNAKIEEIAELQDKVTSSFDVTDDISKKIASSNETLEKALENGYGLDKRIEALFHLDTIVHWFVMFLFILVEITPVLTKLLLPRWTYDILLDAAEKEASAEAFYRVYDTNASIHKRITGIDSRESWYLSSSAELHRRGTANLLENLENSQSDIVSDSIPSYIKK